jgi:S-formylglutathione hydrolase FrmB
MGRGRVAVVVALAAALLSLVPAALASPPASVQFRSGDGLKVLSIRQIDPRQYNVALLTAALGTPVNVRILLPTNYQEQPAMRWPTLYLYTGTGGTAADWVNDGDLEPLTAGKPLIVVTPDIGFGAGDGWWANWVDRTTSLGPNQWETFQIDELIPWIDANLRTRADRDGRAVAGLSQGGFGSMTYATRHPDLFLAAAAFSGAVDTAYGTPDAEAGHAFVMATTADDDVEPFAVFGDPGTDEINWQGHDPTTLVGNLGGMDVRLYTGNGVPGPFDTVTPTGLAGTAADSGIEVLAHTLTTEMAARAAALGVPVHLVDYGPGTHSWPYWTRDLQWFLPHLLADFAADPPAPSTVSYQSIDESYSQWGWAVSLTRSAAQQFSYLSDAGRSGFTLRGTGTAAVTTPGFYPPGASYLVTVTDAAGRTSQTVRTSASGRLVIHVDLGGADPPLVIGQPDTPTGLATVSISNPAR